jgi:two-component system CheB/CheR fusion protein
VDARPHPVFLVDDDAAVRDSVRTLLECCGVTVRDYASGKEFLADPQSAGPGCLITDMYMPGMSGLELLQAMRDRGSHMPAIVITAHADERLLRRLREAGVSTVFEKPVDATLLLTEIERAAAA